eukprot:6123730-Prymnesium_polylepis.1
MSGLMLWLPSFRTKLLPPNTLMLVPETHPLCLSHNPIGSQQCYSEMASFARPLSCAAHRVDDRGGRA